MSGYCPHLWHTITIDHKGDVFHCCKILPANMGSITESNLIDLINGEEIIKIRSNSLSGKLPCYFDCNLIDKEICNAVDVQDCQATCDYNHLTDLYINFGMMCNISCTMCRQREKYKTDRRSLNVEDLIRHIDITPFSHVYLQGGEPLFIEECLTYMDYLARAGKRYSLLTNGLLIDDKMAQRLAVEASLVSISLNAATKFTHEHVNRGSSWETVLSNIQRLKKYRNYLGTDLSINGRMTLTVLALPEIPLFIRSFENFGFDTINFGYDKDTVPGYLEGHINFSNKLAVEVSEALSDVDISKVDTLRLSQLGLFL